MEASDVARITYELIRQLEDRRCMSGEDRAGRDRRAYQKLEEKYSQLRRIIRKQRDEFEGLHTRVSEFMSQPCRCRRGSSPSNCTPQKQGGGGEQLLEALQKGASQSRSSPHNARQPDIKKPLKLTVVDEPRPEGKRVSPTVNVTAGVRTSRPVAEKTGTTGNTEKRLPPLAPIRTPQVPVVHIPEEKPAPHSILESNSCVESEVDSDDSLSQDLYATRLRMPPTAVISAAPLKRNASTLKMDDIETDPAQNPLSRRRVEETSNRSNGVASPELHEAPKEFKDFDPTDRPYTSIKSSHMANLDIDQWLIEPPPKTDLVLSTDSSKNDRKRKDLIMNVPDKQNLRPNLGRDREGFRCVEVIRNKAERAALPGHDCPECAGFLQAMKRQGVVDAEKFSDFMRGCSRHKSLWVPTHTPDDFWNLSLQTPDEWRSDT